MIDTSRGLVRPVITFLVMLTLVIIVICLVVKYADLEMARNVVASFLILVTAITAFWFGQRVKPPTPPTS